MNKTSTWLLIGLIGIAVAGCATAPAPYKQASRGTRASACAATAGGARCDPSATATSCGL